MRKISNSEVSTFLHCKRKYWYEYMMDLEPKVQSGPINKGTMIHLILEQYYLAKMDGENEEECQTQAFQPLADAAVMAGADLIELAKLRGLMQAYFDNYADDDDRYEVLAVETKFAIPMGNFALAGTIDAILRDKEDGSIVPVDHKSSYNFWTDQQLAISGQFVKYLAAMRERGYETDRFMVNQIRTREMKPGNELFKRAFVRPSDTRVKNVLHQHLAVGREIINFREKSLKDDAIPIFDKFGCSNCSFLTLCDSDNEGAPIDYLIEQEYRKRQDYGYNTNYEEEVA